MKYFLWPVLSCLALLVCSCNKFDGDPIPAQSISWRIDNGITVTADTIGFIPLFNILYGKKGTTDLSLYIDQTVPGVYTSQAGTASVTYSIPGKEYNDLSTTITISSNASSRLSGYFNTRVAIPNADTLDITGSFSNIGYF